MIEEDVRPVKQDTAQSAFPRHLDGYTYQPFYTVAMLITIAGPSIE